MLNDRDDLLGRISNFISNVPMYFGLNEVVDATKSAARGAKRLTEESTNSARSLSDYLSYRYFDQEKELFINDGNFIGFLFEIAPIVGVDEGMLKNLNYFFNNEMPEGSFLQFLLVANHDVESVLDGWQAMRVNKHPVIQKLTQKRIDFIRKLSVNFGGTDGRIARDYHIYINFSQKLEPTRKSIQKVQTFKEQLARKLSVLNLNHKICKAEDLIQLVRTMVQMRIPAVKEDITYDPINLLSDQVLKPLWPISVEDDGLRYERGNLISKSYYAQKIPKEFSLHQMIGLLGSGENNSLGIAARFIISYTVAADINKSKQIAINSAGERVIKAAEQWYSRNNRDIKREAAEWGEIIDQSKNNERYLTEAFSVMITAPQGQIEQAEQSLRALYNTLDFQLEINHKLQLVTLLSILPMQQGLFWQTLKNYKLTGTCLAKAVTARLPIHAEWKGVPISGVLLQARRGQLFNYNPFYRIVNGNPNFIVIAPSGGGKSVFLQEKVVSMVSQNIQTFVLDIGQSFANICQLLDGEIIQFGKKATLSLNPFSSFNLNMKEEDFEEMVKCAKALLSIMCGVKEDEPYESAELEKAIKRTLKESNYQLDITSFASYLENSDSIILKRFGATLYSYTKNGIYGKYFAGQYQAASFKSILTVFEFEEIKNDPKLLAIVLQILLMEITRQFFTGDRTKQFMIVVDEAWMLLDFAAPFFAAFVRTVRKYGGSLGICVQNFSDLQKTTDHKVILENSAWTILLKQDEKGLEGFKNSEAFKDMVPLISSISLSPGKYSELLLFTTGIKVIGRLVLDNYSRVLYSTDRDDFAYLKSATASGLGLEAAIEELAFKKYGVGIC